MEIWAALLIILQGFIIEIMPKILTFLTESGIKKLFPFKLEKLSFYSDNITIYINEENKQIIIDLIFINLNFYKTPISYIECKVNINGVFFKIIEYKKIINLDRLDKVNIRLESSLINEDLEKLKKNLHKYTNSFNLDLLVNIEISKKIETKGLGNIRCNPFIVMDSDKKYKEFGLC